MYRMIISNVDDRFDAKTCYEEIQIFRVKQYSFEKYLTNNKFEQKFLITKNKQK